MSTRKFVRDFRRAVKLLGDVKIKEISGRGGHMCAVLVHGDGRTQQVTLPGSPAIAESSLLNAVIKVRKFKEAHEAPPS